MDRFHSRKIRDEAPIMPGRIDVSKPAGIAALGCVASGLVQLIECWIQEGTLDVNSVSEEDTPLLSIAADAGYLRMCKLLLESGADPNYMATIEYYKNMNGHPLSRSWSPIDAAVQSGANPEKRLAITTLLIDRGAQPSLRLQVLEYALSSWDYPTLELLLRHGAGTNEHSDGRFWWLALDSEPDYSDILFEYGVKTHEVILKPETFVHGFKETIRRSRAMDALMWQRLLTGLPLPLTIQSFCLLTEALGWAPSKEVIFRKLQVEYLMDLGSSVEIDVNFRSMTDGLTPLERICYHYYESKDAGYVKALDRLLEGGAEINSNGPVYGTPLHICFTPTFGPFSFSQGWADWCINATPALLLLYRGARVDIRGERDDMTVAELPQRVRDLRYIELVSCVLAVAALPPRSREDFPEDRALPPKKIIRPHLDLFCPRTLCST
ncbi:hypothetical protein PG988_010613 [Apiospora saccharicola]